MASMLSLLDVLPRHERVDIGGGAEIDIFGISAEDLARILERYPRAFQQIADAGSGNLAGLDPGVLGAMLAAAQRNGQCVSLLGNEEVEQKSRSLSLGAQLKVVQVIGRCTFPDGLGPFLEGLASITSGANEALRVIVQVASRGSTTTSPPGARPSGQPQTQASGN